MKPVRRQEWQESVITYRRSPLNVGRPVDVGTWRSPEHLSLKAGCLTWSSGDQWRTIDPPVDLLDKVLKLVDANDEVVAEFARSYGLISECAQHGLPLSHSRIIGAQPDDEYRCSVEGGRRPFVRVQRYRVLARRVRAILNLAARLHKDEDADEQDWIELGYPGVPTFDVICDTWEFRPPDREEHLDQQRENLGQLIDVWLDQCGFRPRFEFSADPDQSFQMVASGLLGAVAVRTMLAVARSDGLAICTRCKHVYPPKQKLKAGRNNYCPDCRDIGRFRDSKRRERQKNDSRQVMDE